MINRTEQEIIKNWKGDIGKPLVSICTITYNHEEFITEALDSFLMQETDFPFEMVIDDDCSPDGTSEIIKKYMKKFPNIIHAKLRDKNVGVMKNFTENMQRAKGKYIATCEGDDYWTDPLKLQKQVGFLEENEEYALCYAGATVVEEDGNIINPNKNFGDSTQNELIAGVGHSITCSTMFRSFDMYEINNANVINGDTLLWHYLGFQGKCKYLNHVSNCVYRYHQGGTWSARSYISVLKEGLKTTQYIRHSIQKKCPVNSEILEMHDTKYKNIFAFFVHECIINKEFKNIKVGVDEIEKLSFIRKKKLFYISIVGTLVKDYIKKFLY